MNLNYIILAHKQPPQVHRLLDRLSGPGSSFYVHIDKGTDDEPFRSALKTIPDVFFCPDHVRQYGTWGDIGIVKATISILKEVVKNNPGPGYCLLLSGQDYPLKSPVYIRSFLEERYGTEFISCFPLPLADWNNGGMERLNFYKINLSNRRGDFVLCPSISDRKFYTAGTARKLAKLLSRGQFKAVSRLLRKRKPFPAYLKPFGGDQWWAITTETAARILGFLDEHPDFLAFHKDTLLPDECFFQSIVQKLHAEAPLQIEPSLTYVNWCRKDVPLPVTFRLEDLDELTSLPAEKLFARKFDCEQDAEIIPALDRLNTELNATA